MHVVVLEDNPDDQVLAHHTLRRLIKEPVITACKNGNQLVMLLIRNAVTPDLFIIDHDLAGGIGFKGVDVVRCIRQLPKYRAVPIIYFTSHPAWMLEEEAIKSGVSEYVEKTHDHGINLVRLKSAMKKYVL